jgi:hypothetical protein
MDASNHVDERLDALEKKVAAMNSVDKMDDDFKFYYVLTPKGDSVTISAPRFHQGSGSESSGCGANNQKCSCDLNPQGQLIMDGTGTSGDAKGLDFYCYFNVGGNQCTIHIDIPHSGNNNLQCFCDGHELDFGGCSITTDGHNFDLSGYLTDPNPPKSPPPPPPKSECNGAPCGNGITDPFCIQKDNGNCFDKTTGGNVCHGDKFDLCK